MTTVPGTYFTKEQLEADRKADKVSAGEPTSSFILNYIGLIYKNKMKQYDKALAWYILAARENDSEAQNNIGLLYRDGLGVPKNYLCALKWLLKAAEYEITLDCVRRVVKSVYLKNTSDNIGELFENGYGVPLDKYKALEWYCHSIYKTNISRLEGQGYHLSEADKIKSRQQLIKETEAILDAEKKKLKEKQNKTQKEIKSLVDINITYKLTGGGQNAWKDVPILLSGPGADYFNEMKTQIQLLSQKNSAFNDQDIELQLLKQEKANLELKIKEKDEKISSLENKEREYHRTSIQQTQTLNLLKQEKQTMEQDKTNITNEMERLKSSNSTLEQLLKSKEDVIMSLNRGNQMLLTANQGHQQGANEMVDTLKSLLQAKDNEIELINLKMENALDKEKEKIKKLLKEIKRLKQTANSRETRPSSSTTVPELAISNTGMNEDDPNNDFNYDTECDTEYTSCDDISSEDRDNANDLNYDSDV